MSQESLLVVVVPANGEWEPMPALWEVQFWSELPAGAVVHDAPLVPVGVVDALYAKLVEQRSFLNPQLAAKNERRINYNAAADFALVYDTDLNPIGWLVPERRW